MDQLASVPNVFSTSLPTGIFHCNVSRFQKLPLVAGILISSEKLQSFSSIRRSRPNPHGETSISDAFQGQGEAGTLCTKDTSGDNLQSGQPKSSSSERHGTQSLNVFFNSSRFSGKLLTLNWFFLTPW